MKNVRASDPITSVMAAEKSDLFSGKQRSRILASLEIGPQTAKGISICTGLTVEQVCRRLPELQSSGRVEVVMITEDHEWVLDGYRVWKKA